MVLTGGSTYATCGTDDRVARLLSNSVDPLTIPDRVDAADSTGVDHFALKPIVEHQPGVLPGCAKPITPASLGFMPRNWARVNTCSL